MSRIILSVALASAAVCSTILLSCVGDEPGSATAATDGGESSDVISSDGASSDGQTTTCTGTQTACGPSCVDLQTDNDNCGKCGNACNGCYLGTCDGKKPAQVAAGDGFGCVVLAAGTVWCWGANESGQLGEPPGMQTCTVGGSTHPCRPTPAEVQGLTNVVRVALGLGFACATKSDHTVWCWGYNDGRLGHDPALDPNDGGTPLCATGTCNPTPKQVTLADGGGLGGMDSVAAGSGAACAQGASGATCWGINADDERGDGIDDDGGTAFRPPATVVGLAASSAISVSAHFVHACALQGGTLWCWGDNFQDALGHAAGTRGDILGPDGYRYRNPQAVEVTDNNDAGISGIISFTALDGPTCAVRSDNSLSCWGFNCDGAAGTPLGSNCNNFQDAFTPTSMVGGITTGVSAVSGSEEHTCAIAVNHQVWCWGASWGGQLGNNSYTGNAAGASFCPSVGNGGNCFPAPQQTPGMLASQISAGVDFTLAIGTDGTVYGWGVNGAGQTGHPPSTQGDANCTGELCNANPVAVVGLPK